MPPLLLFLAALLPLLQAAEEAYALDRAGVVAADGENGPKIYGIDLRDCTDAMCWTGSNCGFGHDAGQLKALERADHTICRNAIYVKRKTSYSIELEVMWEAADAAISLRPQKATGEIETTDIFVCSSDKNTNLGVATTTTKDFHIYHRSSPTNIGATKERPVTYCKFDLQTRDKIGDFMKRHNLSNLCAYVKVGAKPAMHKCLSMRHRPSFYNTFNRNKEFLDQKGKVYFVFFVGYLLILGIIAYPMYHAWEDSLVDYRRMRAFFKFRHTLIELPDEDIRQHYAKKPRGPGSMEHLL